MANIMDYLLWRGDLTPLQAPWCLLDDLLLANLCYTELDGFVPEQGIELAELAPLLPLKEQTGNVFFEQWKQLFYAMADAPRFSHMRVTRYINDIDPDRDIQFCAVTYLPEDGPTVVAFRGTDASLVGWKEDCALSYETVPAQLAAVEYLSEAAARFPGPIITTGHSKGGNLSVYAAAHAPEAVQSRLLRACSFDGPGLDDDTLASEGFARVRPIIHSVIPQSSVVGLLLGHIPEYTYVRSDKSGILQHDSFSWQLKGPHFDTLPENDDSSKAIDHTLHAWLRQCSPEERRTFNTALFSLLGASNAATTYDLVADKAGTMSAMLQATRAMEPESRRVFFQMLGKLLSTGTGDLFDGIGKRFSASGAQLKSQLDQFTGSISQMADKLRPEKKEAEDEVPKATDLPE